MSDKKDLPELINLASEAIEMRKEELALEKLKEETAIKEIDFSITSQDKTFKIANKELENERLYLKESFKLKNRITFFISTGFILILLLFFGLIIFFTLNDKSFLNKLLTYAFDLIKIGFGGLMGYFVKASQKKKTEKPK